MNSDLAHFIALAERGSITAAAHSLSLTQSAVTKSLQRLEEQLGLRLVDRLPRGVKLTEAGERIYRRAKAVEAEVRNLHLEADDYQAEVRKQIRFGSIPFWNVTTVPKIVSAFHTRNPNVTLSVIVDTQRRLLELLQTGELDFALCRFEAIPKSIPLVYEALTRIDMQIACSKDHPILQKWDGTLNTLRDHRWIDYRSTLEQFAVPGDNHFGSGPGTLETNSWLAGLLIASQGPYLMALPRQLEAFFERFAITFIPNSPILFSAEAGLWYRPSAASSAVGQAFRAVARQEMRRLRSENGT